MRNGFDNLHVLYFGMIFDRTIQRFKRLPHVVASSKEPTSAFSREMFK